MASMIKFRVSVQVPNYTYSADLPLSNCHLAAFAPGEEGYIDSEDVSYILDGNGYKEIFGGNVGDRSIYDFVEKFKSGDKVCYYKNEKANSPDDQCRYLAS